MTTIDQIVQNTLHDGKQKNLVSWAKPLDWPPDCFALAMRIIEKSGSYAEPGIALSYDDESRTEKRKRAEKNEVAGRNWRDNGVLPQRLHDEWKILHNARQRDIASSFKKDARWKTAAMNIIAMSDEACKGFGFGVDDASVLHKTYIAMAYAEDSSTLTQLPDSICLLVPKSIVCVQPKNAPPQVGCNTRCLSNYICALPPAGEAVARWWKPPKTTQGAEQHDGRPLNVLAVPYPFTIRGTAFSPSRKPTGTEDGYFTVQQEWLNGVKTEDIYLATKGLISEAQRECGIVDAVAFPELAFTKPFLDDVAGFLLEDDDLELDFVLGGVSSEEGGHHRNSAILYKSAGDSSNVLTYSQHKHHRWKLDSGQIRRYNVGHALSPHVDWWEDIDVSARAINFAVIRNNVSITTLVCEDLARFDPILPVINSVGPNIVFALLMDGPQLITRWPNRYATVLADDPGSAVLSLTSLGMIRRSYDTRVAERPVIGLWRDQSGRSTEINLPLGSHAVCLSLAIEPTQNRALDGRIDTLKANAVTLAATHPITHPEPAEMTALGY